MTKKYLCRDAFRKLISTNNHTLAYIFFCFIIIIQLCYIIRNGPTYMIFYEHSRFNVKCYGNPEAVLITTEDRKFSPQDKSIFFLETSCTGGLNSRQACAVESAARAHPDWDIKILFTGPLTKTFVKSISFDKLASIPNVQFARINVTEFLKDTPFPTKQFFDFLKKSDWVIIIHSSDILRILTLYKYGGIYLDFDVIVMKSFNTLPSNFVVKQSPFGVASGVLALSNDETGRNFVEIAVRELHTAFNPGEWAANGPDLIAHTLEKLCDTPILNQMSADSCNGFGVIESKYFFPVDYPSYRNYFKNYVVNDSVAYMHHIWNALSHKTPLQQDSLYSTLAKKYCPTIYNLYGEQFGT